MEKIIKLLKQISEIVLKEKTLQEEKRKRGENFNIFRVLGLSSSEVRLHSAFIAELLNPKGDHGLGDKFLVSFLTNVIRKKETFPFDSESAQVYVEYSIGNVSSDYKEGGRIDLLIRDKNRQTIIIENKIYAGDQPLQMYRYNEYASNCLSKEQYVLLYLTLDGSQPSEESTGKQKFEYQCISYRENILSWLEICIGTAALYPRIRETITQYKSNLNSLLGIMSMTTETDMLKKLVSEENIEATLSILSLDNMIKTTIRKNFLVKLIDELKPLLDKYSINVDLSNAEGMASLSNYCDLIFFQISHPIAHFTLGVEGKQIWYGITIDQKKYNPHKKVMESALWGRKPQGNVPYGWDYLHGNLRYWDGKEALLDMVKDHKIIDIIRCELQKAIDCNAFEKLERFLLK
jgi:hypothetical protein